MPEPPSRCAVHPARPASDVCPVCGRPRCAADAATAPGGCLACGGRSGGPIRPRLDLRALAGAGVVCALLTPLLAAVGSEYVGSPTMGYVVPPVLGIVTGIAAEFGARKAHGLPLRLLAVGFALLVAAYSFVFVPGRLSPFSPLGDVWWAYVAAAAGAWLWTAPPRRVRPAAPTG